jgi:hypothetical protein
MNTINLKRLAGERFLALLMNRPANDQRSNDTLRRVAAREIIRETRGRGSTGSAPVTHGNGFEFLFARLWAICCRQNSYTDQRIVPARAETITPSIAAAPIVCNDEPIVSNGNNVKDTTVTLPSFSSGTGKQLIPDHEFPSRFVDQTTNNWRASIQQNESINKLRAERSAQLRGQRTNGGYVG